MIFKGEYSNLNSVQFQFIENRFEKTEARRRSGLESQAPKEGEDNKKAQLKKLGLL